MQGYGFKIIDDNYRVYEKDESKQKIKLYLRQHNVQSYLIINPFASTTKRTLPFIQVQKIVKSTHQLYAHIILLIPPYVDNIQEWKNIDNTILCPPINSIMDSVSYIRNCSMVLSVDTSIVHIASAFNKPIVGLYREQDLTTSCWLPTSTQQIVLSLHSSPEQISNKIKILRDHNKIKISS
ncbi:glycosyltransferase family 9 protein [Shewanella surugensis]|uniref:glycosyltransferase family 9 protein n=1 Tax=Shewanella surugensis TaxID=212020 RepID=UPI0035DE9BA3